MTERPQVVPLRACLYGVSQTRKTWVACNLPKSGPGWEAGDGSPGRVVYIASDPTSPNLFSVPVEDRGRFHEEVPDGNVQWHESGRIKTNWREETLRDIAEVDWKKKYPDAVAIVWDTGTETTKRILEEGAALGHFSEKGATSIPEVKGNPRALGKEEGIATPQPGDYDMAQKTIAKAMDWLIRLNPELHIISTWHECHSPADPRTGQGAKIGPMTVGKKGPYDIPQMFHVTGHLTVEGGKVNKEREGDTRVQLRGDEIVVAGAKVGNRPLDIPKHYWIGSKPEDVVEFWRLIEKSMGLVSTST